MHDAPALLGQIIGLLAEALRAPSDAIPCVRCLARPTLERLISTILTDVGHADDEIGLTARGTSAVHIVEALERMSLITPVPFDDQIPRVGPQRLVAVGLGVTPADLDPAELLQAHTPDGVLCYLTALALHGLTTQPTAHHHVARRRVARTKASDPRRDDTAEITTGLAWQTAPQLGPDVTRMAALLTTIGDERLARRTGWMLQQIDLPLPPVLDDAIHTLRAAASLTAAPVPALAGMPYREVDSTWQLLVP